MSTYTMRSKRPEKLFLCDQVIRHSSILDAAIIGELYYWIAKGEQPWRKSGDFADLFFVNERTIRKHFDSLVNDLRYVSRARTRLRNGNFGAYKFKSNPTDNSKALLSIYRGILKNANIKNDYGQFDPEATDYKEIPQTQLLLAKSIEQTHCINSAYLLDRISWAHASRCQDQIFFADKGHFARWSSLTYRTAFRTLEKLSNLGLAGFEFKHGHLIVWTSGHSLEFFKQYMEDKHDLRITRVTESVA